jgi:glycosyltransferase involved in cell wall biosynthesis
VIRLLARSQLEAGIRVQVCAVLESDPTEHPFSQALRADGVEVTTIQLPPRSYLSEWRELQRVMGRIGPSVVHTHGARSDVVAGLAARNAGLPRVTTVHGYTGGDLKNRVYEWCQTMSFRRFEAVVAVSNPLVERLVANGVPRERVHMVRNAWAPAGVATERAAARAALGLDPGEYVIGWVGRVTHEKGLDVLIDALHEYGTNSPLVAVVGAGRERPALEARAAACGVSSRIRWCGEVPDAGRVFKAFDLLVLSSRTEGTPMVLFEAMATGTPVVASRVGGVPDVIDDTAGWLIPSENPAVLAGAIRWAREHPEAGRERAARASARLSTEFTPRTWVERYNAVYLAVQASAPRA